MTFQQLRDWHQQQINNKAFHNEAVRLLNSLIDSGPEDSVSPLIGRNLQDALRVLRGL